MQTYTYKEIKATDEYGMSSWVFLTRRFVYKLTWLFANYTSSTPNQITIISFLFGLLAAYFFLQGTWINLIFGALLYEMSFLLDYVDGRIARLKNLKSTFGAYLDIMTDITEYSVIIICLTYGQYLLTNDIFIFLYGFIFMSLELTGITQTYIMGIGRRSKKAADENTYIMKNRFPILVQLKKRIDPENRLNYLVLTSTEAETIAFFIFPIIMQIKLGMIIGSIILFIFILMLIFYNFLIKNDVKKIEKLI